MPLRLCLTCSTPHAAGGRCPNPACPRHSTTSVYDAEHTRLTRAAIAAEPWCHTPGGCPHDDAGTAANPLTGDHPVAVANGGHRDQRRVVLCRRCNSSKRDRRGAMVRRDRR